MIFININNILIKKSVVIFILSVGFLLLHIAIIATPIRGVVIDAETHEPLPYVNVLIKGTTSGTITNLDGEFTLNQKLASDAIILFSFLGYKNTEINYVSIVDMELLTIYLDEEDIALEEVEIRPDNSYARSIIKSVIKNRKHNNPDNIKTIDYKKYTRKSTFLSNLNRSITEKKAFRNSADAFIVQSDSTVAMPIFLFEQHLSYTINKDEDINEQKIIDTQSECVMPQLQKTINTIVSQKITTSINFYDNQINILSRGFPSPIGWNSPIFYNIYLVDSLIQNGEKHYRFDFYPKSYRSTAFKGYFWIDKETFALTEIYAKLPTTANVNFVNSFEAHIYYQPISQKRWFYKGQKIKLRLALSKTGDNNKQRKNVTVQNLSDYYQIQTPDTHTANSALDPINTEQILKNYQKIPYDSLEMMAYQGIKKLKQNKTIKYISRFSDMTLNGYYNLNKFDLGSYMDIYRKNALEGNRFTLPLRTSEKLFKNFAVGSYIGYGFKDKEIKYGGKINYKLPWERRTILSLKYDNDYYSMTTDKFVEFIQENPYEAGGGNMISSITTRSPNPYMLKQQKISFSLEHQLGKDIGLLLRPFYNRYQGNLNVPFTRNGNPISSFNNYGILTNVRFSFGQPFDEGFFYRVYYGNQKPVIQLSALFAKVTFQDEVKVKTQPYFNINATLKNRMNLGPAFLKILLNVGYIAGDVPFPLLFTTRGTQDLGFARYHYNLLHNSSFAADLYTNVHISFNGGGSLFSKIPVIKKFNLRETISFKSFWGQQNGKHESVMDMPDFLKKPQSTPYMELGFGITNIFKALRIEYIKRLSQAKIYDQFSSKHGIRLRIEVSF